MTETNPWKSMFELSGKGADFDHRFGCPYLVSPGKSPGEGYRREFSTFYHLGGYVHGTDPGNEKQGRIQAFSKAAAKVEHRNPSNQSGNFITRDVLYTGILIESLDDACRRVDRGDGGAKQRDSFNRKRKAL